MSIPYPAQPRDVPDDLTRPTRRYRVHAWGAFAGLLTFLALYFGLIFWFGRIAWRSGRLMLAQGPDSFQALLFALPALFLVVFLIKGLFFIRRGVVMLGRTAPQAWRTEARALLFAFERPYFR